ncbi:MAG: 3-phosphoshikimate 1-carboxyvinyltransferase [Planctomycetota bacterium]
MKARVKPGNLKGTVVIPGSKSHTIRAVAIAALAGGRSRIEAPLASADTRAAVDAYSAAGARISQEEAQWLVEGTAGEVRAPGDPVDIGNSGTSLRFAMGSFALLREGSATLTGDEQIQRRPAGPLGDSLNDLGASAKSIHDNGCAPFEVKGRLRGGRTSIEAVTSQYLSSLILNTALGDGDTRIDVPLLNEAPYVWMTIRWLESVGVRLDYSDDLSAFEIAGGQRFKPFERRIPADFSSATFFLAAGAIPGNNVTLAGLDMGDTQGDKAVVDYVETMGAAVFQDEKGITVDGRDLRCRELDLNATPDALPTMAVLGCLASGTTALVNVPQARIKETDRITAMAKELTKMGARTRELSDGLVVESSALTGARVDGRGDHRIVMALAVAGTAAKGETVIEGAEAVSITFPTFFELMQSLGADITLEQ